MFNCLFYDLFDFWLGTFDSCYSLSMYISIIFIVAFALFIIIMISGYKHSIEDLIDRVERLEEKTGIDD